MFNSLSRWIAAGALSLGLASAASAQLVLSVEPPNAGPGDPVDIVLKGGEEGDYTLVLVALDPGPTTFPLVGTVDVGLSALTLYPLGQFDDTGCLAFPCALDCFAATVDPFYMQGLTVRLTPSGPIVPAVSNPLIFEIDEGNIDDCNGNNVDDDCEIEDGLAQDCDGNGIPDECDADCDGNGMPDACEGIANVYCVENMADDGCSNLVTRIVWIGDLSEPHFILVDGGQFVEYDDGTATFSALVERIDNSKKRFQIDVFFSGRVDPGDASYPPSGSPKESGSCPRDTDSWYYYTDFSGTFAGVDKYAGALYELSPRGPAFQIGPGGSLFNARFGGAAWYSLEQIQEPDSGWLPDDMEGDFNMDMPVGCDCD